ncbi:MAG: ABC transporter substrate-binding protein [Actinomycetota bacterium]
MTRRRVPAALLTVLVLLAASCGSDASGGGAAQTASDESDPSTAIAPDDSSEGDNSENDATGERGDGAGDDGTDPDEPNTTENDGGEQDASCRLVAHRAGETCVPANLERIVVVDPLGALPTLLALDAPVVGAMGVYSADQPWPAYFDEAETAGVEVVGAANVPNLEQIASLDPDLIIASLEYGAADTLADIAPTVVLGGTFYTTDWESETLVAAQAVGAEGEYRSLIDEYHRRADALADRVDALGGVTMTRLDDYGGVYYLYDNNCIWLGQVLDRVGISQPPDQETQCTDQTLAENIYSAVNNISAEQFGLLDADLVLVYGLGSDGTAIPDTTTSAPLWPTLTAVQNDQAFSVDDAWGVGAGLWAAEAVLDDLERFLDQLDGGS